MNLIDLKAAKKLLTEGGVVAIPTETVYGLAGWIYSDLGLKKIFSTKERPFFDPLIVHVSDAEKAKSLTSEWTAAHEILANICWPGPLTLIAKKNDMVNPLITAGLEYVGLRCPRHPETLKLLSEIDGGLAAPSANKFGKTSPTSSFHVFQEFGEEVAIIEGGKCEVGIESTVTQVSYSSGQCVVEIYRPGFYTATMLQKILADNGVESKVIYKESPVAPGQLNHHYMPKIPLIIIPNGKSWVETQKKVESSLNNRFNNPIEWNLSNDPQLASRELYESLRTFDQKGFDIIILQKSSLFQKEEWLGIWNRLNKAKTLEII